MAMKQGDKYYAQFMLIESGRTISRQIHSITVQDRCGNNRELSGQNLPNTIHINTGETKTGKNTADVLISPEKIHDGLPRVFEVEPFPSGRDVLFVIIGCVVFMLLQFVLTAKATL